MTYRNDAAFDTLRSITGATITGSFQSLGAALTLPGLVICFKNQTDGDVIVGTNSTNRLVLPSNSFTIYDIRTNAPSTINYMFAEGTQFQVKSGTSAPTSGTFYMEAVIAQKSA
jgi:hypothetical protein